MKHLLILIFVASALTGCIREAFQPPRPDFLVWTAPGKSVLDVKKKLLECGMPEPSGRDYQTLGRNAQLSISFCMVRAGFHSETDYLMCTRETDRILAICAPGAEISKPSVNRRLNSPYCKSRMDYQYCRRNALYPDGCDNIEYVPPAPECLP